MLGRFHIIFFFLQRFINKTVLKQSKQTMKKFQMMMATVLVALMAFAVQWDIEWNKGSVSGKKY